ncbi:hypothetical protein [Oscillatoria salina]|nr:hypothetical protein [Oscillatoria salina]
MTLAKLKCHNYGNVRYSLDGTKLVVTQGNQTLVSQYVTAWY